MEEEIKKLVDDFCDKLAEHCDSVRIFATIPHTGSSTKSYTTGRGNYYAASGFIHEWSVMQDEYSRIEAKKERCE